MKKQAAALEYNFNEPQGAPRVIAVGEGHVAEKIMILARENGIPVVEDKVLVSKLVPLPLGIEIPPELYEAVAQVLAFLTRVNEERKDI